MTVTRRELLGSAAIAVGSASAARAQGEKRVLAVVGDAYHAAAPLDSLLAGPLRKQGWKSSTIIDYDNVPWDEFGNYDLVIWSREGREYAKRLRERDMPGYKREPEFWLTAAQQDKLEAYVEAGGRLFLYHDGFGNHPKGEGVSRLARAFFIMHPAIVPIHVTPTGKMPELTEGVTGFTVADEEYKVEMDESTTSVFLESHSPQHGRAPQGWAHTYGKGKVGVLIPGHNRETQRHPMIRKLIGNVTDWLVG
jgi:hypothetical protein